jgi:hypothetical protein
MKKITGRCFFCTSIFITVGLISFCVRKDGDLVRNNPADPSGNNWHPPYIGAMNDTTVSINDSINIHAIGSYINNSNQRFVWAVKGNAFSDTTDSGSIYISFADSGTYVIKEKEVNALGDSPIDSVKIHVLLDPPVVNAGKDTTVSINDTVHLHGSATDKYGHIIKKAWDIGNTGKFIISSTFATTFEASATPNSNYHCVLMVVDDDGNESKDTVNISVSQDPPVANAGMDTAVVPNSLVYLHGNKSTDKYGEIVKYEWDIYNTDVFTQCSTGDTGITASDTAFQSVLRVTDDDGNISYDTIDVYVSTFKFQIVTDSVPFGVRIGHEALVYHDRMWVIGGWDRGYVENKGWQNDVWYSDNGKDWIKAIDSAAFSPRMSFSAFVLDDKMWVIGGNCGIAGFSRQLPYDTSWDANDVWWSTDGVNWTCAATSSKFKKYSNTSSVVFQGKIWVAGEIGEGATSDGQRYEVQYSSDCVNWSVVNWNFPVDLTFGKLAVFRDKLWIIGQASIPWPSCPGVIWYSEDGLTWLQVDVSSSFPRVRYEPAVTVFSNMVWIIGGRHPHPGGGYQDMWYSSDGSNWLQGSDKALSDGNFDGRSESPCLIFQRKIWLIGGLSGYEGYPDSKVLYMK